MTTSGYRNNGPVTGNRNRLTARNLFSKYSGRGAGLQAPRAADAPSGNTSTGADRSRPRPGRDDRPGPGPGPGGADQVPGGLPVIPPGSSLTATSNLQQLQQQFSTILAGLRRSKSEARAAFIRTAAEIKSAKIEGLVGVEGSALSRGVVGGSGDLMARAGVVAEAATARQSAKSALLDTLGAIRTEKGVARSNYLLGIQQVQAAIAAEQAAMATGQFASGMVNVGGGEVPVGNAGQVGSVLRSDAPAINKFMSLLQSQLGVAYDFGTINPLGPSGGPGAGFDCSGYIKWAAGLLGVTLPHSAQQQYNMLPHISRENLQPGDLVFFDYPNNRGVYISHVGVYAGNGQYIDAGSGGVELSPMPMGNFVAGGRISDLRTSSPPRNERPPRTGGEQQ